MDSKNHDTLVSFALFCEKHPEFRFWQALRNWSGARFIFVAEGDQHIRSAEEIAEIAQNAGLRDTFFREGK